ncbi:MAG: bifunctional (p)ppGpp synthetase/guanosine-3',5'-bis(diphosphate) 3'-pyrophosphohydrolase [Bacteroidales bacterium]|nr:bifunctional (p)ppGpp synthetase/guanosine-3',5'-bis(diphosphate) 3'-pyrophosphohydrolase [Bacteroidales bacterium]
MTEQLKQICSGFGPEEAAQIEAAYNFAAVHLEGRRRSNSHPFIEHPLGVASIVAGLGLDADSVAAVFVHEASCHNEEVLESWNGSSSVRLIAEGLDRISRIKPRDTMLEADRYRKLIVSYSSDPRVFVLKLADRLEIMRSLNIFPKADQARKNAETMLLYIPLAHQTGLYNIKSELEDLWMRYAEPEQYRTIKNYLKSTEGERARMVESFINPLKDEISARGISYHLKARTKSVYSIWRKMQVQHVPITEVYDVFAIRFIIDVPPQDEISTCWDVFAMVTENYPQDERRLRQWLERPKPNGYQSLHCTVNIGGQWLEVQIRSERMDFNAEMGGASHWSYKGVKSDSALSFKLSKIRQLMENPESLSYDDAPAESLGQDVFVFTPDGELRQMKGGSTVLDFAFDIHSNIGLKCSGGLINGKMVSIKEVLKTGDTVEIITSKNQKPAEGWLNFVVTSKARSKIKQKLKERENILAAAGKELLDRRLRNWKLEMSDTDLGLLVKKYKFHTANELFGAIGREEIDLAEIKTFLQHDDAGAVASVGDKTAMSQNSGDAGDILEIGGKGNLSNIDYKMAKCCNPVYGDDVFGFVAVTGGIKIHRISCPNASRLLDLYPHRVQKVRWRRDVSTASFQVTIKVIADEERVTADVVSTINGFRASVRNFSVTERAGKGDYEMTVTIFVPSNLVLDKIIASLKKIKDIRNVSRQ